MAKKGELRDNAPATNDAYTGILAISLVALIAGCLLLFLDYSQYEGKPNKPNLAPVQKAADEKPAPPVVPPNPMDKGGQPMPMPMPMQNQQAEQKAANP